MSSSTSSSPLGLNWRSSTLFITSVVTTAMFTDLFLFGLIVPILPFALSERLKIPSSQIQSSISFSLSLYSGFSVIFSPVFGHLSDKYQKKQSLYLVGLLSLLISTYLLMKTQELRIFYLARALQGCSAACVWVIGWTLLRENVGQERLGVAMGTVFSFITIGELIAPSIGGLFYRFYGYESVFYLAWGLLSLDVIMRVLMIDKQQASRYRSRTQLQDQVEGEGGNEVDQNREDLDRMRSAEAGSIISANPVGPIASNLNPQNHVKDEETKNQRETDEASSLLKKDSNRRLYVETPENGNPDSTLTQNTEENQTGAETETKSLFCIISDPRFITASLSAILRAIIGSTWSATIPLHAKKVFHFDSFTSSLLFLPLVIPGIILGPLAGNYCDKLGSKRLIVPGFLLEAIFLFCLRFPTFAFPFPSSNPTLDIPGPLESSKSSIEISKETFGIILYGLLLMGCGSSICLIGTPAFVESSKVVDEKEKAFPGQFGEGGAQGRIFSFQNIVFCTGLTIGPLLGGALVGKIGYGNMNAVLAVLCVIMSGVCQTFLKKKNVGESQNSTTESGDSSA